MSEITDYLKEKIVQVSIARLLGELVCGLGSCVSVVGLFLKLLLPSLAGFSLLFAGLYLSVHFEFQRLDYVNALDRISRQEK